MSATAVGNFPANRRRIRDYLFVRIPEFTCTCYAPGQLDFPALELGMAPDRLCVELKSLKLYLWSFRERGAFHEAVTNEIANHLEVAVQPRFLRLAARFNVRGGIYTTVVAERRQPGWQPTAAIALP